MRVLIPAVLILACRDTSLSDCLEGFAMMSTEDGTRTVTLNDDALDGPLVLQLVVPWGETRYNHGAPGAVFVHGAWTNDAVPLSEEQAHLVTDTGAWSIYVNLPGGRQTMSSGGEDDRRGAGSRQAIGAALRYSANMLEDNSGCLFEDRIPQGLAEERVLAAFSNGGNLAWATLADANVELPTLHGIVSFETPANSQMALGEPGTESRESLLHTEGACAISTENALVCDYDYSGLSFSPDASSETGGLLFIDADGDGNYSEEFDFPLGVARSEEAGVWAQSLQVTEATDALSLQTQKRLNSAEAAEFWGWREAPRSMPAAITRFPELAGMAIGTETDHVLIGATDHPHVTGMVAAMQKAHMRWTRLHPDRAYVESLSANEKSFADISANTEVQVGDLTLPMEPEDDNLIRGSDYLSAGVLELLDRSWRNDWSNDLDMVLTP